MFSICNTAILVEPGRLQLLPWECAVRNPGLQGATGVDKAYKGE